MWIDVSIPPYNGDIQMAVDAAKQNGGTVYLPAGVYQIDEAIRLPDCVSLVGDGYCSTIQLRSDRQDNVIVADGYPAASDTWSLGAFKSETRNLRIAHLRIRGNRARGGNWQHVWSGCGIMLLAASHCVIENCWIKSCFRGGILLSTGMGIDNPLRVGSQRNLIRDCRIISCGGTGIDLAGGERNEATGCDFASIEGCHIEDAGIMGIRIVRSKFARLTNNTVTRANEDSIRVDQCEHVLLTGNIAVDGGSVVRDGPGPDSNGIKISHSLYCLAIGNICHNNNKPNLELLGSQWCAFAHNVASGSGDWGVICRTTVPASGLVTQCISEPYQDAEKKEYQIQNWINTGHSIEGNIAVRNKSGGIGIYGGHNSIVSGNVAALNNQQGTTEIAVPGISITTGDGKGGSVESLENAIVSNRCYDDQGAQTQTYGLLLATGPNLVMGNNTMRNASGGVDIVAHTNIAGIEGNR